MSAAQLGSKVFAEAAEVAAKRAALAAASKAAKAAASAAAIQASKAAVEAAAKKAILTQIKEAIKRFAIAAMKAAGEAAAIAATKAKAFAIGVGKQMVKHPKMVALGLTAAAVGTAALIQHDKKNGATFRLTKLEKKSAKTPNILTVDVEPVNGDMFELSLHASFTFLSANTAPSLATYSFPVKGVYTTKNKFDIDISEYPIFANLVINNPVAGELRYNTSFDSELLKIFRDTTKMTVDTIADIAEPAMDAGAGALKNLADKLGLELGTLKNIMYFLIVLVAFVVLYRPISSLLSSSSQPSLSYPNTAVGGQYIDNFNE